MSGLLLTKDTTSWRDHSILGQTLKNGTADQVEDLTEELLDLLERQIAEVEERIKSLVANDAVLSETAALLRSVPGIGPVACAMPVTEMPELGQITGEQAAALVGLAPIARDSGRTRGKRSIGGGRRALRQVLYQAALVASYHNTDLKAFADRLRGRAVPTPRRPYSTERRRAGMSAGRRARSVWENCGQSLPRPEARPKARMRIVHQFFHADPRIG